MYFGIDEARRMAGVGGLKPDSEGLLSAVEDARDLVEKHGTVGSAHDILTDISTSPGLYSRFYSYLERLKTKQGTDMYRYLSSYAETHPTPTPAGV